MHSLPQEIEVWYVIPAIRREFVKEMKSKGLNQSEIAVKLGLTRAAVSQYVSGKRGSEVKFSKDVKEEISKAVVGLMEGREPVSAIQRVLNFIKKKGCLCDIHKKLDKNVCNCGGCCK